MKKYFFLMLIVTNIGCASYFKRKDCEKTNWFAHGKSVAMRGERLDADPFINSCVQVEANVNHAEADLGFKSGMGDYCQEKTAYNYGKKGMTFNFEMCNNGRQKRIQSRHADGVKYFCQKENGFRVGASGFVYNDICPESLERSFLGEYYKGRKKYLLGMIDQKKREVGELEKQIQKKTIEKSLLISRLNQIRGGHVVTQRRTAGVNGHVQVSTEVSEDAATQQRRQRLNSDIHRVERELNLLEQKMNLAHSEISDHEKELATL